MCFESAARECQPAGLQGKRKFLEMQMVENVLHMHRFYAKKMATLVR